MQKFLRPEAILSMREIALDDRAIAPPLGLYPCLRTSSENLRSAIYVPCARSHTSTRTPAGYRVDSSLCAVLHCRYIRCNSQLLRSAFSSEDGQPATCSGSFFHSSAVAYCLYSYRLLHMLSSSIHLRNAFMRHCKSNLGASNAAARARR